MPPPIRPRQFSIALIACLLLIANRSAHADTPINLTGAWAADDGAIYYIRHLNDNSIWWAGLHNSGFHLGVRFTNVFRGVANLQNRTIEGSWADVPRGGGILQQGRLSLDIIVITSPDIDLPPEPGRPPRPQPTRRIELRQKPEGTTGGFAGRVWTGFSSGQLRPQNINNLADRVRRYNSSLLENNPPYKDFAVVFGHIGGGGAAISWDDNRPRDYFLFVRGALFTGGKDGDIMFDLDLNVDLTHNERQELDSQPGFWTSGWLRPAQHIMTRLNANWLSDRNPENGFHCEIVMFGRQNDKDHSEDPPIVLIPGWAETRGNSVLINGLPINGNAIRTTVASPPGSPPSSPTVGFRFVGPDGVPSTVALMPGKRVRMTGVIATDPDHDGPFPDSHPLHRAEIHPVYAIDIVQDFEQRRPGTNVTGVWHANDVGTYYMRQLDGNTLWWLGLSRDQGRSFANVFHGTIQGNTIRGEWADIPVGVGGASSNGRLTLVGDGRGQLAITLTATERTGGFGGSGWQKLYDRP
jgi:hypothetical protein